MKKAKQKELDLNRIPDSSSDITGNETILLSSFTFAVAENAMRPVSGPMFELEGKWISSCSLCSFFGLFAGGMDDSGTARSFKGVKTTLQVFETKTHDTFASARDSYTLICVPLLISKSFKGSALCRWDPK
jgi:hypothetical protein